MEDKLLISRLSQVHHFELLLSHSKLPFECHSNFAIICKETDEWVFPLLNVDEHESHKEKKKRLVQSRISLYGPMIHPQGETMKVLLSAKHSWSLFIFDDALETAPSQQEVTMLTDAVCQIAAGTYRGKIHSSFRMYHEVLNEFRSLASPTVLERYLKSFQTYVHGTVEEASLRSKGTVPNVDTYQAIRRKTVGMDVVGGVFMEFCMGLELNNSVTESHEFIRFNECVIDHISLVNDLLSFRKDYFKKCSHNILAVKYFHSGEGTSFQQVVDQVCAAIQHKEREILELQARLVDVGHAPTHPLRNMLSTHCQWELAMVLRYRTLSWDR